MFIIYVSQYCNKYLIDKEEKYVVAGEKNENKEEFVVRLS